MKSIASIKPALGGLACCIGLALGSPVAADQDRFVESNLLGIFYHELAHALIDIMQLPIFGQEEDAADVLSILLIHDLWDEDDAVAMAYDTAFGFLGEAEASAEYETAYWDVHGPDLQRYYNLVCLFYGGNPEERVDIAEDLGLPEERAEGCEEEFELAYDSWGAVLDDLQSEGRNGQLVLRTDDPDEVTARVMSAEIAAMNDDFRFPQDVPVLVEACDEANAFYDMGTQEITMCTEFAPHLAAMYQD